MQKISFAQIKTSAAGPVPTAISLIVLWAALMFSKALVSIALVAALVFWVLWRWQARDWRIASDPKLLGTLIAFMLWTCLSFFWSDEPKQSLKGISKMLQLGLIFLLVLDVFRATGVKRWERSFLFIAWAVLLNGWFQYFTGHDLVRGFPAQPSGSGVRLSSSFNTYGLFACYLISSLPVLAGLAWRSWKQNQNRLAAGFGAAFFLSLPLLYMTRSRGAILAAILGLLLFLIYRRYFLHFLAVILISVAAVFALPKNVVIHLDIDRKEQSLVERWYLWDRALHVIKAKPLTGTGINTYAAAHQKYDKTQNWRVKNYYAHNGYLQLAAETGIPGLVLFLLFLFQWARLGFKNLAAWAAAGRREGGFPLEGIVLGLLNFLILALVDTVFHNPPSIKLFWYFAALALAYAPSKNQP